MAARVSGITCTVIFTLPDSFRPAPGRLPPRPLAVFLALILLDKFAGGINEGIQLPEFIFFFAVEIISDIFAAIGVL